MSERRDDEAGEITLWLEALEQAGSDDEGRILDRLVPLVYGELRLLARSHRYRWQGAGHGTTSLVHEAYAKLARGRSGDFANRRQFFQLASKTMRSILVDNARWHRRQKRGGGASTVPLEEAGLVSKSRSEELLALDECLGRLESRDPDLAKIVECRCFAGMTIEETADTLDLSPATVKRRWNLARAWLYRELAPSEPT